MRLTAQQKARQEKANEEYRRATFTPEEIAQQDLYKSQAKKNEEFAKLHGVTVPQLITLNNIKNAQGHKAKYNKLPKGSDVRTLPSLLEKGLLIKSEESGTQWVTVTEKGSALSTSWVYAE